MRCTSVRVTRSNSGGGGKNSIQDLEKRVAYAKRVADEADENDDDDAEDLFDAYQVLKKELKKQKKK